MSPRAEPAGSSRLCRLFPTNKQTPTLSTPGCRARLPARPCVAAAGSLPCGHGRLDPCPQCVLRGPAPARGSPAGSPQPSAPRHPGTPNVGLVGARGGGVSSGPGSQGRLVAAAPLPSASRLAVRLGPMLSRGQGEPTSPSPGTQGNCAADQGRVWGRAGLPVGSGAGRPGLSGPAFLSLTKLSPCFFLWSPVLTPSCHCVPLPSSGSLFHPSPFPQGPRAPRRASELLFTTSKPKQAAQSCSFYCLPT